MHTLTTAKTITFNRDTHDFDATFDGNYIGSFATFHQAENELNQHVLLLCEQGLIDQPLAALAEQALGAALADDEPADDDPTTGNWSTRAAIPEGTDPNDFGDVGPERAPIPAVRTTARAWLTDDLQRDALARQWSEKLRQAMDASAESYAGITKALS